MREQKNVYVVNGTALSKRLKMIYPHTWNMVKFNGQYSHIDVTWDLEPIAILLISANSRCVEPPFAIVRTYCF